MWGVHLRTEAFPAKKQRGFGFGPILRVVCILTLTKPQNHEGTFFNRGNLARDDSALQHRRFAALKSARNGCTAFGLIMFDHSRMVDAWTRHFVRVWTLWVEETIATMTYFWFVHAFLPRAFWHARILWVLHLFGRTCQQDPKSPLTAHLPISRLGHGE